MTSVNYAADIDWSTGISSGAGDRVKPVSALALGLDYGYHNLRRLGMSHPLSTIRLA